jgi:hypothetical protein
MTAAGHVTPFGITWTPEEDAIVRENYQRLGAARTSALTGRSVSAVEHRAIVLGVLKRRRWTKDEDRRIVLLWGEWPTERLATALGRSQQAVARRGHELGMKFGCPRGMETMRAAIARTGFTQKTLRQILAWAGVEPELTVSWCAGRAPRRRLQLDQMDVDDAIEGWLKLEVVAAAARRHGVPANRLMLWLQQSGEDIPPKPRGKRWWRVPSDVIDRVVSGRCPSQAEATG